MLVGGGMGWGWRGVVAEEMGVEGWVKADGGGGDGV